MAIVQQTGEYYVLQGQYGCGWEDLTADETWTEAKQSRRDYAENEGGTYRIIVRRKRDENRKR